MRSHRDRVNNTSGGGRVESGYISSPDGNYEFDARTTSLPHHHVPHSRDKEPFVTHKLFEVMANLNLKGVSRVA